VGVRITGRKVAACFMGVALDGFWKADSGHSDCKTGEWRHSSLAVWWCQWDRSRGVWVGGCPVVSQGPSLALKK